MIAAHVSYRNECDFCQLSHSAAAAAHRNGNYDLVEQAKINPERAGVSGKLKALLTIAGKVQQGGKQVATGDVERAKQEGATDREIHDTVLIAAAFCMFNRYVDGRGRWRSRDYSLLVDSLLWTARLFDAVRVHLDFLCCRGSRRPCDLRPRL